MPRNTSWTEDQLRSAVADSQSMAGVCARLGLRPGGGTYASLRRNIARLGIDASHLPFVVDGRVRRTRAWSDDDLRDAVRASVSLAEVQRRLGYQPSGGMHRFVSGYIRRLEINTDHFLGQGWSRGKQPRFGFKAVPLAEILVANSRYLNSARLRSRLIRAGLKQGRCEECALDTWRGEPLPLALDHVNGDPCDNRIENLRILCPNCHALTKTWCGRNRGRRTPTQRDQA